MNISSVSFRSTTATPSSGLDIKTLVSKPQTFQKKETPQAAGPLNGTEKKKSTGKKILGLVVGAGAILAGIALGAKKGIFLPKEGGKQFIETAKKGLNFVGEKVLGYGKLALDFGKEQWSKIKTHLPNKEKLSQTANDIINEAPNLA